MTVGDELHEPLADAANQYADNTGNSNGTAPSAAVSDESGTYRYANSSIYPAPIDVFGCTPLEQIYRSYDLQTNPRYDGVSHYSTIPYFHRNLYWSGIARHFGAMLTTHMASMVMGIVNGMKLGYKVAKWQGVIPGAVTGGLVLPELNAIAWVGILRNEATFADNAPSSQSETVAQIDEMEKWEEPRLP